MKTSFLIPCRGRLSYLKNSIKSIVDNCSDLSKLEIVCRIDDDDAELNNALLEMTQTHDYIKMIVGASGEGYGHLHRFYNDAISISTGDYLYIWGSDNVMKTKNWDVLLDNCTKSNPLVVWPHKGACYAWFPCISKDWFSCLKQFSDNYPYVDTYIDFVVKKCKSLNFKNVEALSNISVEHIKLSDSNSGGRPWNNNKKTADLDQNQFNQRVNEHATLLTKLLGNRS